MSLSSSVSALTSSSTFITLTRLDEAFFYDWLDRNAAKKGKALPEKIGSMQYFLHGFTGNSPHALSRLPHSQGILFTSVQTLPTFFASIPGPDGRSRTLSTTRVIGKEAFPRGSCRL